MDNKDSNVVSFRGVTRLDINPDQILEKAIGNVTQVVVIGIDKEDGSAYFASSTADGGDVLWMMEKAKNSLMRIGGIL